MPEPLAILRQDNKIFSHVRQKWLDETPEENVRQNYLCVLVNEYGYALDQIAEEVSLPGKRGNKHARADFVIWRTAQDKRDGKTALIVVECKADNVTINPDTYEQGANYANNERAKFFIAHNRRSTKFFKVDLSLRAPNYAEVKDIPHASASDAEIKELLDQLKPFEGKEFADLLHQCHNIIRNNEHLDPAAAFDEIAKILFVKVMVERRLKEKRERKNLFTVEFLKSQIANSPIDALFLETKNAYRADKIFADDERINLRPATTENIVRKLEGYNLSDTSEDIKGIAFERFLGGTFRGDIGQFFTPRPIVEFVVRMLDPQEGECVCDPASGSGGFLIRCFEIIREAIAADVDKQYKDFCETLDAAKRLSATAKAKARRDKYAELQEQLTPYSAPDAFVPDRMRSRIYKLSNLCIYGTDANDRMARTSKMNMIMHGDGHGGVHHHNGLLNVNGIFEGRFQVIATNPPFGASVTADNIILPGDYHASPEAQTRYRNQYGKAYEDAVNRVQAAAGKPILSLFQLPRSKGIKTEILFIERCLDLLAPGGRLGIVLPEGIFNNPSLQYVREFVEDRATLRAIVSLSQDTFKSSGASVKCSILFLQKHTNEEAATHAATREKAHQEVTAKHRPTIDAEHARLEALIKTAKQNNNRDELQKLRKELATFDNQITETITTETRALLKQRLDYPIFLYEAEHVGITATGDPGPNELYPNDNQPASCEKTCLELYREFQKKTTNPHRIPSSDSNKGNQKSFSAKWTDVGRWNVNSFAKITWNWPDHLFKNLGEFLKQKVNPVDVEQGLHNIPIIEKISFSGIISLTEPEERSDYKGRLFWANVGDFVYSKIRAKQGSFAVVSPETGPIAVSAEYPVFEIDTTQILPDYLPLLLRTPSFLHFLESLSNGGDTKTRIAPELFKKIRVPIPPIEIQRQIVTPYREAQERLSAARAALLIVSREVEETILGHRAIEQSEHAALNFLAQQPKNLTE